MIRRFLNPKHLRGLRPRQPIDIPRPLRIPPSRRPIPPRPITPDQRHHQQDKPKLHHEFSSSCPSCTSWFSLFSERPQPSSPSASDFPAAPTTPAPRC